MSISSVNSSLYSPYTSSTTASSASKATGLDALLADDTTDASKVKQNGADSSVSALTGDNNAPTSDSVVGSIINTTA